MRASRSAQEGFPEKVTTGAQHENKPEGGKEGERVVGRERMHRPPKGWEHGKQKPKDSQCGWRADKEGSIRA